MRFAIKVKMRKAAQRNKKKERRKKNANERGSAVDRAVAGGVAREWGSRREVENKMKMGKKVTDRQHQLNELKDGKASWLAEPEG